MSTKQNDIAIAEIYQRKPKKEKAKKTEEERPLDRCKISKPVVQTRDIEAVLKEINVEQFGPGEQPMKELATVSVLLKKGVTVDEVILINCTFSKNSFPSVVG